MEHFMERLAQGNCHCDANSPAVELPQRTASPKRILTVYLTKQVALFAE